MAELPLLGVYGAHFAWSPGALAALNFVTASFETGSLTAVLGPNGSGKSTLLKVAAGILPLGVPGVEETGIVRYVGKDLTELSIRERAQKICYVGSDLRCDFPLTVAEVVELAGGDTEASLKRALCWHLRDRSIQTLSGGERQLVLVARALAQGARALLLDETLSRMDLHHQAEIGALLQRLAREERKAVALVAHDVNLATRWADHAILMQDGQVVGRGGLAETLTEAALRKLYPGARLTVTADPGTGAPRVFFS